MNLEFGNRSNSWNLAARAVLGILGHFSKQITAKSCVPPYSEQLKALCHHIPSDNEASSLFSLKPRLKPDQITMHANR